MKKFPGFLKSIFPERGDRGAFGNRRQKGKPGNTPPAYSRQSGLPPEFAEKYNLTKRQARVTEVLLLGKSDKEIGASLEIAVNTVQTHLKNVYKKTGVRGRCALMALVGGKRD
jgi:DNA-binding CsgD family transcriptional regulator